MAEPTEKSPEVEKFLSNVFGFSRKQVIEQNQCTTCGADVDHSNESGVIDEFRDDISRREYQISGMCQKCQDKIWGEE